MVDFSYPGDRVDTPDGPGSVAYVTREGRAVVDLDESWAAGVHERAITHRPAFTTYDKDDAELKRRGYRREHRLRALSRRPSGDATDVDIRAFMARKLADGSAKPPKRPRPFKHRPRKLTDKQADRMMRDNWALYGVGPYPGTPAEQLNSQKD